MPAGRAARPCRRRSGSWTPGRSGYAVIWQRKLTCCDDSAASPAEVYTTGDASRSQPMLRPHRLREEFIDRQLLRPALGHSVRPCLDRGLRMPKVPGSPLDASAVPRPLEQSSAPHWFAQGAGEEASTSQSAAPIRERVTESNDGRSSSAAAPPVRRDKHG